MRHHTNHMQHFNYDLRRTALALMLIGVGCGALHAQQAQSALTRDGVAAPVVRFLAGQLLEPLLGASSVCAAAE